jgi:hypothetical protein
MTIEELEKEIHRLKAALTSADEQFLARKRVEGELTRRNYELFTRNEYLTRIVRKIRAEVVDLLAGDDIL